MSAALASGESVLPNGRQEFKMRNVMQWGRVRSKFAE